MQQLLRRLLLLLLTLLAAFERMPVNGISGHNLTFTINYEHCNTMLTPRQPLARTLQLLRAALG